MFAPGDLSHIPVGRRGVYLRAVDLWGGLVAAFVESGEDEVPV